MKYSISELEAMPLNVLRNIDIRNAEEEEVIQKIVNKKQAAIPAKVDLGVVNTDDMNAEKEAKLQAEIDAKREAARLRFVGEEEEVQVEPEVAPVLEPEVPPTLEPEVVSPSEPAPVVEPEKVEEPPVNLVQHKDKFCEFCDSKGVRHKKECTRPNQ